MNAATDEEGLHMSHRRRLEALPVPRSLIALARAAERECPPGHAQALRALGSLAALKMPSRGVLWSPGNAVEEDLYIAIRQVAERHLGAVSAAANWRRSFGAVVSKTTVDEQNALEDAYLHAKWISQTTHFYTGLAFGVTFADWSF